MPRAVLDIPPGEVVRAIPPPNPNHRVLITAFWVNWTRESSCAILEFLDYNDRVFQSLHHSGGFRVQIWPPNPEGWFRRPPVTHGVKIRWTNRETETLLSLEIQWTTTASPPPTVPGTPNVAVASRVSFRA